MPRATERLAGSIAGSIAEDASPGWILVDYPAALPGWYRIRAATTSQGWVEIACGRGAVYVVPRLQSLWWSPVEPPELWWHPW